MCVSDRTSSSMLSIGYADMKQCRHVVHLKTCVLFVFVFICERFISRLIFNTCNALILQKRTINIISGGKKQAKSIRLITAVDSGLSTSLT